MLLTSLCLSWDNEDLDRNFSCCDDTCWAIKSHWGQSHLGWLLHFSTIRNLWSISCAEDCIQYVQQFSDGIKSFGNNTALFFKQTWTSGPDVNKCCVFPTSLNFCCDSCQSNRSNAPRGHDGGRSVSWDPEWYCQMYSL